MENRINNVLKFLVVGLITAGLGACALLQQPLAEPKVNLQKVDVTSASLSDAVLVFNFMVDNPNAVPLNVDQVTYNLNINGKPLTKGILEQGFKVGANSSINVPLPIQIRYSDLSNSISDLWRQGSTPYEVEGAVKLGLLSIPYKKSGEIKMSDIKQ
jgi:LEA14-like dessication related protein